MSARRRGRSFTVRARSAAPVETVFALLADARSWNGWTAVRRVVLEREGVPAPDGVGAIRRFSGGPITSREEVVECEPPRHFAYVILSGLPIRGYRADVDLDALESGTSITWRASFDEAIPGTGPLLLWFLHLTVQGMARGLARRADELARSAPHPSP